MIKIAGINVLQHEVFKISASKLKYYKWDLSISKNDAIILEEIVPLFQSQAFRSISKLINVLPQKIDYTKYILAVVIDDKSCFKRVTSKKGVKVNGITFRRFVGTTGGLKSDTLLFVSNEIYDKLYEISECKKNKNIPFIPAKLEAYRALFFSSSQEIISPNKILVTTDCITKFKDDIIKIDDTDETKEPVIEKLNNVELENNVSDGFNLCTYQFMKKVSEKLGLDYVPSGVCLRNAWLKGMMYPFPIEEFANRYCNGNFEVKDVWGNSHDIRDIELILTESSLKLWKCYDSIEHYVNSYKECGFEFSVTKIAPNKLEDERELNYQYLQSYEFSNKDIEELCEPTIKYLKDSLCGDYEQTINFLGIDGDLNDNSWQQALYTNEYMLRDPYIIDSVYRYIKKKINNAKIGKLKVNGNYQIASGDPFALMQHICGLEVTGLLKKDECYSKYWNDKKVNEIVVFRSPMTSHNNIRKCKVIKNDEVDYWYQYMNTIMIINGWDTFCMAENGCDWDGDILYSTDNKVLLKKHIELPAIQCVQRNTEKVVPTEEDIIKSNRNGMGNKVGQITNRVTAMKEVQSRFPKDSKEWEIMDYRMACGQLYQQNELDKIKGIDFKPMPKSWYSINDCHTEEEKKLCADKKPYFFIYIYDYVKSDYEKYIKQNNNKCLRRFNMSYEELLEKKDKTEEEEKFIYWYNKKMPIGFGDCAMNKICWYIEKEFEGHKLNIKHNSDFDYNVLKVNRRCTEKHRQELFQLMEEYIEQIRQYKNYKSKNKKSHTSDREENFKNREYIKKIFHKKAQEICPNDDERLNIILDMCYGCKNNRQFCWDVIGDLVIKRLEELKINGINH